MRTPLAPAAVAVGAMTPDLPLFTGGVGITYGRTHDAAWLPLTIIVAAALLVVWRCLLRPAVRELAPLPLAQRLPAEWDRASSGWRETAGTARQALWTVAALTIGVVSHIVWDSFTHEGRAGVELVPALAMPWGPLTGYKWLQYGSAVVGLALIGVWMLRWLRARTPVSVGRTLPGVVRGVVWVSLPAMLVAAWLGGLWMLGPLSASFTPAHLAYRVLPPACGAWGAAMLALCVILQRQRVRRRRTRSA